MLPPLSFILTTSPSNVIFTSFVFPPSILTEFVIELIFQVPDWTAATLSFALDKFQFLSLASYAVPASVRRTE